MDKHIKKHAMTRADPRDAAQFEEDDEFEAAPSKRQKVADNEDGSEDGGNWNTVQEDDEEIDSEFEWSIIEAPKSNLWKCNKNKI